LGDKRKPRVLLFENGAGRLAGRPVPPMPRHPIFTTAQPLSNNRPGRLLGVLGLAGNTAATAHGPHKQHRPHGAPARGWRGGRSWRA